MTPVMKKISRMVIVRHWDLTMTGERTLITRWQELDAMLITWWQDKTQPLIHNATQNDPLPQQFTQPKNVATLISPDSTLPMVWQSPQRQSSDWGIPIKRLAEAIADIASKQRPRTLSSFFKPTTTNTLIFDGKKEKFELFEDLFQTVLKMKPGMSKVMKIEFFLSHLVKEHYKRLET